MSPDHFQSNLHREYKSEILTVTLCIVTALIGYRAKTFSCLARSQKGLIRHLPVCNPTLVRLFMQNLVVKFVCKGQDSLWTCLALCRVNFQQLNNCVEILIKLLFIQFSVGEMCSNKPNKQFYLNTFKTSSSPAFTQRKKR